MPTLENMDPILRLDQIVKTYGSYRAVNEVSFAMPKGSIFGLLGPNGAGKTSLIRIITTITRPDSGQILFEGQPLNSSHPEQIGYLPEERGLYKKMKVGEHLIYLARIKGLSARVARQAIGEWFEKFGITDWWDKKVEELSKGMQQKVQFVSTVVHQPRLLILDEPFSGLDPINSNLIRDEVMRMHREGTSIIFSTHRMEQVEALCENILLINKGMNVLQGRVDEIKQAHKKNLFRISYSGILPDDTPNLGTVFEQDRQEIIFQLGEGENSNDLLRFFIEKNVQVTEFKEILPSLNEIFIARVNESEISPLQANFQTS